MPDGRIVATVVACLIAGVIAWSLFTSFIWPRPVVPSGTTNMRVDVYEDHSMVATMEIRKPSEVRWLAAAMNDSAIIWPGEAFSCAASTVTSQSVKFEFFKGAAAIGYAAFGTCWQLVPESGASRMPTGAKLITFLRNVMSRP